MQIKILPSKGIINIFAILNITGYKDDNGKPNHPLRSMLIEDLADLIPNELVDKFNKLKNEEYPIHEYWLAKLGVFSNDGFRKLEDDPDSQIIVDRVNNLIPLLEDINKSIGFEKYYQKSFFQKYQKICEDLTSELVNYNLNNILANFWEIEYHPEGVLIPNPLDACFRGYGYEKENKLFSINGPSYDPYTKTVGFNLERSISLFLHECSHSYVKMIQKNIKDKLESEEVNHKGKVIFDYAKKRVLKENKKYQFWKDYNQWSIYIEEQVVRAGEVLFTTQVLFRDKWSEEAKQQYREGHILDNLDQGLYFIDGIVRLIESYKRDKSRSGFGKLYIEIINFCYKKIY